jgi:hypothetical protein
VSELEVSLDETSGLELADFHKESKQLLRVAIIKFRLFLNDENRKALDKLWHEYRRIRAEDLRGTLEDDSVREALENLKQKIKPKPSELLSGYLKQFREFAE